MSSEADSTTERKLSTSSFDPLSNQLLRASPARDMSDSNSRKVNRPGSIELGGGVLHSAISWIGSVPFLRRLKSILRIPKVFKRNSKDFKRKSNDFSVFGNSSK